jgi:hypothetical protein
MIRSDLRKTMTNTSPEPVRIGDALRDGPYSAPVLRTHGAPDPFDPVFYEFASDIGVRLRRLEASGVIPEAILLRADLWPGLSGFHGYPVLRLVQASAEAGDIRWGVLA